MFYPLFSRLVPSQPLQNASHHIRNTKEIPGGKSQLGRFNYSLFFFFFFNKLAKILVYIHSFQTYILAENVKMRGCHWKHLEVLSYCLANIFTASQRTGRRKALTSCGSNRTPATWSTSENFLWLAWSEHIPILQYFIKTELLTEMP